MTGAFAAVQFELAHPEIAINVPASALIVGQNGLHVATVGADDRVVLKSITIARDLGKVVEYGATKTIFMNPHEKMTEDYVTGRFG